MSHLLVIATFPNPEIARQIGTQLVERQHAACVNLLPGATSIYLWKEKVESAEETVAFLKTTEENYPALEAALSELHPYEVPEIIALKIDKGLPAYLDWVSKP